MSVTRRDGLKIMGAAGLTLAAGGAIAQDGTVHEVEMLNRHPDFGAMVFNPPVVRAQVGDTIRFLASDRGHNAESSDGLLPEGAEEFAGRINEEVEYTVAADGIYGINCKPHRTSGMVGLLVVGEVESTEAFREALDDIRRVPRKSQQRYEEYLEMADEMLAAETA